MKLANEINQTPIEILKENVEETCTKLLLDKNNFNCKCEVSENLIDFKSMIKIYYKLYKIKNILDYFYIANSNLENKEKMLLNELDKIIKVHKMEKEEEKISFIYDDICERMLEEIAKLKYCYFINGKCLKMRYTDGFPNSKENGCCSNTYKSKGKDCKYLKEDYSCSICSISCRLFTCLYLQERGIDHSLWQYPIIDCNIGKFTRVKLVRSFFIPKEKMMRKLHNKIK